MTDRELLKEATALLERIREATEDCDENDIDEARQCVVDIFHMTAPEKLMRLSRAPAQPAAHTAEQCAVRWMRQCMSAKAKLAAVRRELGKDGFTGDILRAIQALLTAPSPGAGEETL